MLRGSGVPWDLRKLQPYELYSEVPFNIIVGQSMDAYSRYLVRFLELLESISIVNFCIDEILLLNHVASKDSLAPNIEVSYSKNSIKYNMEDLIFYFKHFSEGLKVPKGSIYTSIEAPKGETGVFLVSDGSSKPFRCKIKSPGYMHLQILNLISKNYLLADLVTNIGSLDIVFGEIDR